MVCRMRMPARPRTSSPSSPPRPRRQPWKDSQRGASGASRPREQRSPRAREGDHLDAASVKEPELEAEISFQIEGFSDPLKVDSTLRGVAPRPLANLARALDPIGLVVCDHDRAAFGIAVEEIDRAAHEPHRRVRRLPGREEDGKLPGDDARADRSKPLEQWAAGEARPEIARARERLRAIFGSEEDRENRLDPAA